MNDWERWREVLVGEWRSYERGDSDAIPRYSIARMMGADAELARDCAEGNL